MSHVADSSSKSIGRPIGSARPEHHLSDEVLLSFAAGSLDAASRILVSAHIAMCDECAQRVRRGEDAGGALLDLLSPARMADDALAQVMARIDEVEQVEADSDGPLPWADPGLGFPVPEAVRQAIATSGVPACWQRVGPGIDRMEIPMDDPGHSGNVRLLRIAPNKRIPVHTHVGSELTMVLQGGYHDEYGAFGPGDVQELDGSIEHGPVSDPEGCVVLTVTEAPLHFTGVLGKFANLFARF